MKNTIRKIVNKFGFDVVRYKPMAKTAEKQVPFGLFDELRIEKGSIVAATSTSAKIQDIRPIDFNSLWKRECLKTITLTDILGRIELAKTAELLQSVHDALVVGGSVKIVVDDIEKVMKSILLTSNSDSPKKFRDFNEKLNPTVSPVAFPNITFYDRMLLEDVVKNAGFTKISILDQNGLLVCTGTKITRRHERQVSPSLDGIRSDHKQRYFFASELISGKSRVSDVACGIGYGSYIIAKASPDRTVYAVDLDAGAIEYAIQNYSLPNIDYICNDVRTIDRQIGPLDAVISFETIEHIPNPRPLLVWASEILKKDGVLICSTPNEDKLKFTKAGFPYHEKHYTPYEFEALLTEAGFKITGRYTQHDRETGELVEGWDGLYNIAICTPA